MHIRILASLLLLCGLTQVHAGTPLGGLTLAISPDASTLLVGGDNRTIYVMDPGTLEVKQRVWLGTTIVSMSYNKDGSIIAVEDSNGVVQFLKASDYTKATEQDDLENMAVARDADMAAGLDDDYQGNAVRFFSLSNGVEKGKVIFPKGIRISCFGISPEGDKVAVLQNGVDDPSEKKLSYKDIPKDLKGIARDEFQLKNDGKTAILATYKVPSGEKISEHKTFYTSSSTNSKILFDGDDVVVVNYSNDNARYKPDGSVELFELGNSFNYGSGLSPDQELIFTGGLRNGSITKVDDMTHVSFRIQKLPGWPEYFKGFCSDGNGNIYGATSGFRVVKIDTSGKIIKETGCF